MKKILALVMVFAIFVSIATFPAAAATTGDGIEPRYPVYACPDCGHNVRFIKHVVGETRLKEGASSCPYKQPGTTHYHYLMMDYDKYGCENCNYTTERDIYPYKWCYSKPGKV